MTHQDIDTPEGAEQPTRQAYESPQVTSGPIFEKTVLGSGCTDTVEEECEPNPCPD